MHDLKLCNNEQSQCAFLIHLWDFFFSLFFFLSNPAKKKKTDLQHNTLYIVAMVYRQGFSDLCAVTSALNQ